MTAFGLEWRSATISTEDGPLLVIALTVDGMAFLAGLSVDDYRVEFHREDRSCILAS